MLRIMLLGQIVRLCCSIWMTSILKEVTASCYSALKCERATWRFTVRNTVNVEISSIVR